MDNKKSTGRDGISVKLLKSALPYITETLTYVYSLCVQTDANNLPSTEQAVKN